MIALVISPDEVHQCEIDGDLEILQHLVGPYIEHVSVAPGVHLWVNDEGRPQNLAPNGRASVLGGRPIVGTAVLCGIDEHGEGADLPVGWRVIG